LLLEEKLEKEFIEEFGEEAYQKLKEAACYHIGDTDKRWKNNFKQAILIPIGYECIKNPRYREFHKIPKSLTWKKFKAWLIKHREEILKLKIDCDDIDFLGALAGEYDFLLKGESDENSKE